MVMRHVPNVLTLLRLALVPALAYALVSRRYDVALGLFLASAVSDFADGYLARRFHLTSKLGAFLDPVADKLNMFVATVWLAWDGFLPLWLALAIIARDVVIVVGALFYRWLHGQVDIAPTRLSKWNTALEFAMLLLVLATAAGWLPAGMWQEPLFAVVAATVAASGVQYVWLGSRAAFGGGER